MKKENLEVTKIVCIFAADKYIMMEKAQVIDNIRQVASSVLPRGSKLYLYGSRARGDAREDSDWDLLLLLDQPANDDADFKKYIYPIIERGYDLWQYFSVHTYTKKDWYEGPHALYYFNVEKDKQLIYES
ncbi:MAG: nucleotidyltransferase domain-containing protein [Prevotella sp.]|jgi:predicted nucleotidyltransferase|nr:nucleotidyltransferase domain-containing protein [Prevotella sp.]